MTQTNLGTALATLGARESGTERLWETVTAYRNALEERGTRERVPLQWVMMQRKLTMRTAKVNAGHQKIASHKKPNLMRWTAPTRRHRLCHGRDFHQPKGSGAAL